jgi:hypothetical protein
LARVVGAKQNVPMWVAEKKEKNRAVGKIKI